MTVQSPTPVVALTRAAPVRSLTRQQAAYGTLRVNLTWRPGRRTGLLSGQRHDDPIILDLGCLYEYADGSRGVVQALGECFDDQHTFGDQPICWLDSDARSGPDSGGENLFVDLSYLPAIRRLLVFAFGYEGPPRWAAADAVLTLHPVAGPRVAVRLDRWDRAAPLVAVAMLDNTGDELCVRREMRYVHGGQRRLDDLYGWGIEWRSAGTE